jgi:hypothetical protein
MIAIAVIEGLIKLGTIITDAASKKTDEGKFDFTAFLASGAPQDIQTAVKDIVTALKPDDIAKAITNVEQKQKDLLAGKSLVDFSNEKLMQYATLTDTKLLLNTARVKRAVEGDLFSWLMDDGLGKLIKVATVALPLLV